MTAASSPRARPLPFDRVPRIAKRELSRPEQVQLEAILELRDGNNRFVAFTDWELAEILDRHENTVRRHYAGIESKGYLIRVGFTHGFRLVEISFDLAGHTPPDPGDEDSRARAIARAFERRFDPKARAAARAFGYGRPPKARATDPQKRAPLLIEEELGKKEEEDVPSPSRLSDAAPEPETGPIGDGTGRDELAAPGPGGEGDGEPSPPPPGSPEPQPRPTAGPEPEPFDLVAEIAGCEELVARGGPMARIAASRLAALRAGWRPEPVKPPAPPPPSTFAPAGAKTRASPGRTRVEPDPEFPLARGLDLVRALDRADPVTGLALADQFARHFAARWRDAKDDTLDCFRAAALNLGSGLVESLLKQADRKDLPANWFARAVGREMAAARRLRKEAG